MRTATSDALKVDIFRKITMLDNEEQLRQVYDYLYFCWKDKKSRSMLCLLIC